jgi:asparagine synthase (glutamine-hydrolysing)
MLHHMRRRGPDAEGVSSSPGVVLGHRRLAILDLAARANQPLVSRDQRYSIVFNGEIYNFRELRRSLEQQGVSFHTTSDTEVLLALYSREGADMLRRLRGMFALAIWDTTARELFLARDPYGIKPLYYASTKDGVIFASQVKALVASQLTPVEPEPAGIAGFHLWGSVPEPWTLYRNLLALPAGHWLRVRDGVPGTPVCWHDIRLHWRTSGAELATDDLGVRVREALTDSVRAHLVSDVPVSVFLSGGVDSAVLAALASELGASLEGITVGFEEFAGGPDGLAATNNEGATWQIQRGSVPAGENGESRTYAYPNPFSPFRHNQFGGDGFVRFQYQTTKATQVTIKVFDFAMDLVAEIVSNKSRSLPGNYAEIWNGKNYRGDLVANGVYFYRVELAGDGVLWGKVMVLD